MPACLLAESCRLNGTTPRAENVQVDYLEHTDFVLNPRAATAAPSAALAGLRRALSPASCAMAHSSIGDPDALQPPSAASQHRGCTHPPARPPGLRAASDADIQAFCAALRTAAAWQDEEDAASWTRRIETAAAVRGVGAVKQKGKARGQARRSRVRPSGKAGAARPPRAPALQADTTESSLYSLSVEVRPAWRISGCLTLPHERHSACA